MNKRAQSAMEYLMTYGWAILVVLIALGALFYLGVFSPSVPNTGAIGAPFSFGDIVVTTGEGGDQMIIGASGIKSAAEITITGDCTYADVGGVGTINNGENTIVFTGGCEALDNFAVGDRVSGGISIAYFLSGSDLPHTITGTWSATVE